MKKDLKLLSVSPSSPIVLMTFSYRMTPKHFIVNLQLVISFDFVPLDYGCDNN